MADWRLEAAADDVGVCVTELVSNAFRHGTGDACCTESGWRAVIRMTLRHSRAVLQVDVHDPGAGTPVICPFPSVGPSSVVATTDGRCLPEDGRGLHIVQALSDGLTWRHLPVGKVVSCWFEVGSRFGADTVT